MAKQADYGAGHPDFLAYVQMIVNDPNYADMPDVYKDDGTVQWEAPSNRASGKFQYTHRDRHRWWQTKAQEVGIDPTSLKWISRTARYIHPTKVKPCKRCGRSMSIYYAYSNQLLLNRFAKVEFLVGDTELDPIQHITDLVASVVNRYGEVVIAKLPALLKTGDITPPDNLTTLEEWQHWIVKEYIPTEPTTLSPGAMANPPDRLDGFHSFNLCCRGSADRGRSKENLATYVSDRRAIEYWSDGDYVAADNLMGLVRTSLEAYCSNPKCNRARCTADHIGPISLGFAHRPEFDLECRSCNSAGGNRMRLADVAQLMAVEAQGQPVISWFCKPLWDLLKHDVKDNETALRLGKLLNEQLNNSMLVLHEIAEDRHYSFLISYMNLEYSEYNVRFVNLRAENGRTRFDEIKRTRRSHKYVTERKARRIRVGFDTLKEFAAKDNRSIQKMTDRPEVRHLLEEVKATLRRTPEASQSLDEEIHEMLTADPIQVDNSLRLLTTRLPAQSDEPAVFNEARTLLEQVMSCVANEVSGLWENEKFSRADSTIY
jgi:Alw26I/Eco31I/Esp3I family type II restriction endonuclease